MLSVWQWMSWLISQDKTGGYNLFPSMSSCSREGRVARAASSLSPVWRKKDFAWSRRTHGLGQRSTCLWAVRQSLVRLGQASIRERRAPVAACTPRHHPRSRSYFDLFLICSNFQDWLQQPSIVSMPQGQQLLEQWGKSSARGRGRWAGAGNRRAPSKPVFCDLDWKVLWSRKWKWRW